MHTSPSYRHTDRLSWDKSGGLRMPSETSPKAVILPAPTHGPWVYPLFLTLKCVNCLPQDPHLSRGWKQPLLPLMLESETQGARIRSSAQSPLQFLFLWLFRILLKRSHVALQRSFSESGMHICSSTHTLQKIFCNLFTSPNSPYKTPAQYTFSKLGLRFAQLHFLQRIV